MFLSTITSIQCYLAIRLIGKNVVKQMLLNGSEAWMHTIGLDYTKTCFGTHWKTFFFHFQKWPNALKRFGFSAQLIGQSSVLPVTKTHSCCKVKTHSLSFSRYVMLTLPRVTIVNSNPSYFSANTTNNVLINKFLLKEKNLSFTVLIAPC